MIFADTSAALKLVQLEAESAALRAWIVSRDEALVGSELLAVELIRACRRANVAALPEARAVLDATRLIPLTRRLLDNAAGIGAPALRSLDAIHLASALSVRADLTAFLAYDRRLADAAAAAGLPVVAPGA